MKQKIFSKNQLKRIRIDQMQPISNLDSVRVEVSGIDSDNQTSSIYLSDQKNQKVLIEFSPSQISHFLFFSHHGPRLEKNFFRTPYDQLLDFIDFIGGEIRNVAIVGKKYEMFWGVLLIAFGNEVISISMPAADAIIYAVVSNVPIKITKEIFEENSIDFED